MSKATLTYPIHEFETPLEALLKANNDANDAVFQGWKISRGIKHFPDRWEYIQKDGKTHPVFIAEEYSFEVSLDNPLKRVYELDRKELVEVLT